MYVIIFFLGLLVFWIDVFFVLPIFNLIAPPVVLLLILILGIYEKNDYSFLVAVVFGLLFDLFVPNTPFGVFIIGYALLAVFVKIMARQIGDVTIQSVFLLAAIANIAYSFLMVIMMYFGVNWFSNSTATFSEFFSAKTAILSTIIISLMAVICVRLIEIFSKFFKSWFLLKR